MSNKSKVGSPKKYNCAIKTITISIPVDAISAVRKLIEIEKRKYLVGPKTKDQPKDQSITATSFIRTALNRTNIKH